MTQKEWQDRLKIALRAWCSKNNYPHLNTLARELGISDPQWNRVINGYAVLQDIAKYAAIYHKTGLPEADPRTIPPRKYHTPKGAFGEVKLAWDERRWQNWIKNQSKTVRPQEDRSEAIGQLFGQFGSQFAELVAERVAARMQPLLSLSEPEAVDPSLAEIFRLATGFLIQLRSFSKGGYKKRDDLANNYGKLLAEIFTELEPLLRNKEEREALLDKRKVTDAKRSSIR